MPRVSANLDAHIDLASSGEAPHSRECEDTIIGSIFLNNPVAAQATSTLVPDDFYVPQNIPVFRAIQTLLSEGSEISPVLVGETLKKTDEFTKVGQDYLQGLRDKAVFTADLGNYISIVKKKSTYRQIAALTRKLSVAAWQEAADPSTLVDEATSLLFQTTDNTGQDGFEPVGNVAERVLSNAQEVQGADHGVSGLTTGFAELNKITAGLHPQDLIIIAGRPSMGKTGFGITVAQNAALLGGAYVAVFSLEMSNEALVQRMLASDARVNSHNFRNGTLTEAEWKRLGNSFGTLANANVFLDDSGLLTPTQLRSKALRLRAEQKRLDLIVVDYIQLMDAGTRRESRQQEVTLISRQLKAIAKELKIPLIAISQLSRAPEQRTDHRPQLSDLRESGAIEQDADLVGMLYREEYYNPTPDNKGLAELIIPKQRNGPTGTVRLAWISQFTRFENLWYEGMET